MKQFAIISLFSMLVSAPIFGQSINEVVFSFDHNVGAEKLELGQTVFSIWNNKKMVITRAAFYISEAELHHPDGAAMPLNDQYLLVNADNPAQEFVLGSYSMIAAHGAKLHIGVPQSVNHNDPALWPNDHPLALQNPTMHWGWSAGYRFLVVEGKIDNNDDGVPESVFQWHNLGDALYKTLDLTGMVEAADGKLHVHFVIDWAKLFQNMAMTGNLTQHGSASANIKMMNNAANEGFITMPSGMVSIAEVLANSAAISVNPNPFSEAASIQFAFEKSENLRLEVTNALGQTVRTLPSLAAVGSVEIERGDLPTGVYQAAFFEGNKLIARKRLAISE